MENSISRKGTFFEKHKSLFVLNVSALFVFVICAIIRGLPFSHFDTSVMSFAHTVTSQFLTSLMIVTTEAFDPYMLFSLTLILTTIFISYKKYLWAFFFMMTIVCAGLSSIVLKDLFQIARPLEQVITETGWSFPSSHATGVAVFFFLTSYAIEKRIHESAIAFLWILVAVSFVIATGFSRIYLGVHVTTDVLAGFALGTFWATLGIIMFEHRKNHVQQLTNNS